MLAKLRGRSLEVPCLGMNREPFHGDDLAYVAQVEPPEVPASSESVAEQLKVQMARRGCTLLTLRQPLGGRSPATVDVATPPPAECLGA